jgi:hypothetical protein
MWNLADQKFVKPAVVTGWAVVVYDTRNVRTHDVGDIIQNFKAQADLLGALFIVLSPTTQLSIFYTLGIKGLSANPPVSYPPGAIIESSSVAG